MREIKLRNWQTQAIEKCINWLTIVKESKHFVINAAPGSGKTICASVIASKLIQSGEIERVIVIAPRSEVVRQWGQEFEFVTARHMSKVTGADDDIGNSDYDLCATWQAIENLSDGLREVCNKSKTLVICDEHHHCCSFCCLGQRSRRCLLETQNMFLYLLAHQFVLMVKKQFGWLMIVREKLISLLKECLP